MHAKLITIFLYLLIGGVVIVSPLLIRAVRGDVQMAPPRYMKHPYGAAILLGLATIYVGWVDGAHNHKLIYGWVIISVAAGLMMWRQSRLVTIGVFAGLVIASSMPWWRHELNYIQATRREITIFAAIALTALAMLLRNFILPPDVSAKLNWQRGAMIAFTPVALFLSFGTGIAENPNTQITWWHHWGAYVGPAELMLSGGHIFRDFPAQYGLGPTFVIAAACRSNCWVSMYYIVGVMTFALSLMVLFVALELGIRARLAIVAIPVVTIIACFFWTSYGPAFSSPILYPSVAGLRFTPVVALVAALFFCERSERWDRHWQWLGHGLWAMGALWSPESLYAISFVWWPYFCWRRAANRPWRMMVSALTRALAILAAVLLATLATFLALYYLSYHELPLGQAWLAYMLYPPGPMPINPKGPIWWYGIVLALGVAAMTWAYRANGNSHNFRRCFLVVLLGYGALSYCMGRGHDNNFLNLAPYAMLIIVAAFGSNLPLTLRASAAAMLASMIGWIAIFGWSVWRSDYQAGRIAEFEPAKVTGSFAYTDPEMARRLKSLFADSHIETGNPDDAARAIDTITKRSGEGVTMLDSFYLMPKTGVWDAFHPLEIYPYMPQNLQTKFLMSTAKRLKRSGWVIADKKFNAAPWLEEYEVVYDLAGEEDFGTYHAYHFVPKSDG